MRIKIAFQGDYSREFGGDKPRIWRTYAVYIAGNDMARIEQEPPDYHYPFRAYSTPAVIGGNYIGQFKTKKEAIQAIRQAILLK